jgi:hypothetical protein
MSGTWADGPVQSARGEAAQLIITLAAQRCSVPSWAARVPGREITRTGVSKSAVSAPLLVG